MVSWSGVGRQHPNPPIRRPSPTTSAKLPRQRVRSITYHPKIEEFFSNLLVPGPESEIDFVRHIYRLFVSENRSEKEIAAELNGRGVLTDVGRPRNRGTVHQILINEKYVGNNV